MKKEDLAFAAEDTRRLLEARFDLIATAEPADLSDSAHQQAALAEVRTELADARGALFDAVLEVAREGGETDAARVEVAEASSRAGLQWRYVRGEVGRMLNPPPEDGVEARVLVSRQKAFAELFALSEADFGRLTTERKVQVLGGVVKLASDVHAVVLGAERLALITGRLVPVAEGLDGAQQRLQKELRDDRAVYVTLFAARTRFDRCHAAFTRQVEAALTRGGRLDELGRFVRANDPAYRARRLGGQSLKQEEGVAELTSELGGTPDSIVEPPA